MRTMKEKDEEGEEDDVAEEVGVMDLTGMRCA